MALTPDQQKQLDKLTALANADDDDEDYEIEIREGDRSARVPYRKGKDWLETHFGISLAPPSDDAGNDDGNDNGGGDDTNSKSKSRTSQKYFGKNKG